MAEAEKTLAEYCSALVRRSDEARWVSAQYCEPDVRDRLIACYAIHHEIAQIPNLVSEPPLGEIRLQWWREALTEIVDGKVDRAHPVLQFAASTKAVCAYSLDLFDIATEARAYLLYGDPFASAGVLLTWLDQSEGYLARLREGASSTCTPSELADLTRTESVFALKQHSTGAEVSMVEEAIAVGKPQIDRTLSLLKNMTPEQNGWHLHLALANKKTGKGGNFSPIVMRLRIFKAAITGRF